MRSSSLLPLGPDPSSLAALSTVMPCWWTRLDGIDAGAAAAQEQETWRLSLEKGAAGWLALDRGEPAGAAFIERLDWDSQVFGRPVGRAFLFAPGRLHGPDVTAARALLRELLARARAQDLRHLSLRLPLTDPAAVQCSEDEGFRLFGSMTVLVIDCTEPLPATSSPSGIVIRDVRPEDHEALAELAAETSYPFSRFNLDPAFSPAERHRFYRRWALDGAREWALWSLVAEHEGRLVGFALLRSGPVLAGAPPVRLLDQTLVGVLSAWRNRGVFDALARTGLARAAAAGFRYLTNVVNVENLACQRVIQRLGGTPVGGHHILHLDLGGR